MYKKITLLIITSTLLVIGSSLLINYSKLKNYIIITPNNYIQILKDAHENIDNYVGKKIIVSGYVYIREDFSNNNFVIAQNVALDPSRPDEIFVVGFLCENSSERHFLNGENVKIHGKIEKREFNKLSYPVIVLN